MIGQIELVSGIMKLLGRHGVKHVLPRQINAIINGANHILDELGQPYRPATPGCGRSVWLASDDVGLSSKFMLAAIDGGKSEFAHPHDADDFSRCVKLLDAVPEIRGKMSKLMEAGPVWKALVKDWSKLEAMYQAGQFEALNKAIADITKGTWRARRVRYRAEELHSPRRARQSRARRAAG